MARFAALALAVLASCGPVGATTLIDDAEIALGRAHAADGEKYALYETTLADLYLIKAREEQGHAHYADAMDLASECIKASEAASRKAAEKRTGAPLPIAPTATIQHPADKP